MLHNIFEDMALAQSLYDAICNNNYTAFVHLIGECEQTMLENAECIIVDTKNVVVFPVLMMCLQYRRYDMLEYILHIDRINVNVTNGYQTPLTTLAAYKNDKASLKCLRILTSLPQIDINMRNDKFGKSTALSVAAFSCADVARVKVLLAHKCIDVNSVDDIGLTPLMLATCNLDGNIIRHLVRHTNIDVNMCTRECSALTIAVEECVDSAIMCMRQLLNHKQINVHWMNDVGNTALMVSPRPPRVDRSWKGLMKQVNELRDNIVPPQELCKHHIYALLTHSRV
jgi:hypothetical protein